MLNKAQECPLAVSPKGGLREIGGLRRSLSLFHQPFLLLLDIWVVGESCRLR